MADLQVQNLRLNFSGAPGYEHRMTPIASAAARLFAQRVQAHPDWPPGARRMEALSAGPLTMDFDVLTDDDAASRIAGAWFEALMAQMEREE